MNFLDAVSTLFKKGRKTQRVNDSVSAYGRPIIIVRDRDGNIVSETESDNMILDVGRRELCRMLAGDSTARISHIELGKGGVGGDPWTPIAPAAGNTDLATPLATRAPKAISAFEYEAGAVPKKVSFSVIFDASEVNEIVSEAVLKFSNGVCYARYTFPAAYLKTDRGYSLEIIWAARFS